jgi:hypothetical protein
MRPGLFFGIVNRACIATGAMLLALAGGLRAQTIPLYINSTPVNVFPPQVAPQVDATGFLNLSIFNINTFDSEVPYQMLNNVYFTNRGSGQISGYPGFRWDFYTNGTRRPMDTWFNQGIIQSGLNFFFFGGNPSAVLNFDGPWLTAWARNLTNRGVLQADYSGLLQLRGSNVSVGRSILATGNPNAGGFGSAPDSVRIIDRYWAVGTNNTVRRAGPTPVTISGPNFTLRALLSFPSGGDDLLIQSTSRISSRSFPSTPMRGSGRMISDDSSVVHIVFAPAINRDPAIATEVEFFPDPFNPASAVVGVNFKFVDFDPENEVDFTNGVVLQDALAFSSPVVSITNPVPVFRLPAQVPNVTSFGFLNSLFFFSPFFSPPGTGEPANATFDPGLIFGPDFLSNRVFMPYVAYGASIPLITSTNSDVPNPVFNNPSNYPGRIEILSDNLNLDRARLRAESTAIIKTKNLASNQVARVDAPFINLDLASTQPLMLISNFTRPNIRRLSGNVSYWSGIWTNYVADTYTMTTNQVLFHVMMVDNDLQTIATPGVNVNEFLLHSTNIVIADSIRLGRRSVFAAFNQSQKFLIEATNLTLTGELVLPDSWSWSNTNVFGLINFTNRGDIFIPGAGMYGTDRPSPYENFVNIGENDATSQLIRTLNFENAGSLTGRNGPVEVNAINALLHGAPPDVFDANVAPGEPPIVALSSGGSQILSGGDVQFLADSLTLSNAVIVGGTTVNGVMSLFVTNSLTDAGPGALSYIWNHGGVDVRLRPANSSLLGTALTISAGAYEELFNVWAGEDLGPVAAGYTNNLAVGRLTLNFGSNSLVFFSPLTDENGLPEVNAMYVEYLELLNAAQDVANTLAIDQNFTIYSPTPTSIR